MLVNTLDQAEDAFHLRWLRHRRVLEELDGNKKALTGLTSQMEQTKLQLGETKGDDLVSMKDYKRLKEKIEKFTNDMAVVNSMVETLEREALLSKEKMEEAEEVVRIAKKNVEERGRLYEFKTNQS